MIAFFFALTDVAMSKNHLVEQFKDAPRWVNWKLTTVNGRKTKVPVSPRTGRAASSTKASDWTTFDEARKKNKDAIGITFAPDQLLLGIDIDKVLKEGTTEIIGEQAQSIAQLIIEADTYTEISPSGTGLHLFLRLTSPLSLDASRHEPFEAYTDGRYFTVTQAPYKGYNKPVREVSPQQAIELLQIVGYPWGKGESPATKPPTANPKEISSELAVPLDDALVLKKMFSSSNGAKIKALYEGDISAYIKPSAPKGDASAADAALLAHLAFWTRRAPAQMESLWLSSPLGKREKTQNRKDYRDRSIAGAIKRCKEVYTTPAEKIMEAAPALELLFNIVKGEQIFVQNTENICRILRHHPAFVGRLRYDAFKNKLEIKNGDAFSDLADHDIINIQTEVSILFPCFGKVGKDMVNDAVLKVCREQTIDSASDWVRSLVWDKTARLDSWISKTFHTPDDIYHKAVSSNWFKGLVARIIRPGCKFDYVLVLEGKQGIKKSTSLGIIGSPFAGAAWHVETTMSTENKDFFMQMEGKVIIEFSEGETLSRTETKRLKAIITMQSDKYRPAYGRLSVDFPRRCVFAMTTNQDEYLKDETGNRRWLPVACEGIADVEWLSENLTQLYAEAYHRVTSLNETLHEFPFEETSAAQRTRRIHDPNEDLIAHWYLNKLKPQEREEGVTINQCYRDAICGGFVNKPLDRYNEMSIGDVFRSVIRLERRRTMIEGVKSYRYYSNEMSLKQTELIPVTDLEKF